MDKIIYDINLNMRDKTYNNTNLVFTQGDKEFIQFNITVKDRERNYADENINGKICMIKPDGKMIYADLIRESGIFTYTIRGQELAAIGRVQADIKIYENNGRVSTKRFTFDVMADTTNIGAEESKTYITEFEEQKEVVDKIVEEVETTKQELDKAIIEVDENIITINNAVTASENGKNEIDRLVELANAEIETGNWVSKQDIKNDLATETEGYVADARQLKILNDKIESGIGGGYKEEEIQFSEGHTPSENGKWIYKSGNVVEICLKIESKNFYKNGDVIAILAEEYRPKRAITESIRIFNTKTSLVYYGADCTIDELGNIIINRLTNTASGEMSGNITYIVDK